MSGWISVKDRLPEITEPDAHGNITYSGNVLTFITDGDDFTYMATQPYTTNRGGRWSMCLPGEPAQVTHWMPLPEPPAD